MSVSFPTATRKSNISYRAAWLCGILLLTAAAGCRTIEVTMLSTLNPEAKTALVLPLNESATENAVSDYTFWGMTGGQDSGRIISRIVAHALGEQGILKPVPRESLYAAITRQNVGLADLGSFERQQALELARELKADVIVTGKVHAYRTSWFFFVSLTTIEFELWAADAASGEYLWEARFRDAEIYGKDTDMLALAARKIGNKLKAGLAERAEVGP